MNKQINILKSRCDELFKSPFLCFMPFQNRSEATKAFERLDFCTALAGETSTMAKRLVKPGTRHC